MRTLQSSFPFSSLLVTPFVAAGLAAALGCSPATDDTGPVGGQTPVANPQTTPSATHAAPVSSLPPVMISTAPVVMNPVPPAGTPSTAVGGAQGGGAQGGGAQGGSTPTVVTPVASTPAATPAATTAGETAPPKAGTGNDIVPNGSGWVAASTNGVGVEGAFYAVKDAKGSTATATFEGMKACIKGSVSKKADEMDDATWGAGMGFNFLTKDMDPVIWDGSKYKGIDFTVEATSKATMIVQIAMDGLKDGKEHSVPLTSGKMTVAWTKLAQESWVMPTTTFDPKKILQMKIMVKSDAKAANDYSVCISGMKIN